MTSAAKILLLCSPLTGKAPAATPAKAFPGVFACSVPTAAMDGPAPLRPVKHHKAFPAGKQRRNQYTPEATALQDAMLFPGTHKTVTPVQEHVPIGRMLISMTLLPGEHKAKWGPAGIAICRRLSGFYLAEPKVARLLFAILYNSFCAAVFCFSVGAAAFRYLLNAVSFAP